MRSRKGARWAIYTLQDMTGVQELLAFPESFAKLENVLKPGTPLLLKRACKSRKPGRGSRCRKLGGWKILPSARASGVSRAP